MGRPIQPNHRVGAVALVVVLALSVAYTYVSVLGGSLLARPTHVTVQMNETGGIFEGSAVSYRGVPVGSVESVDLVDGAAVVELALDAGAEIPTDVTVVARTLSPAGEQFLDLQPTRGHGPFLADGATISADRTTTPTSVAQALRSIDTLMEQIDEDALHTVLTETHAAFADPEDLSRVVTATSSLVRALDEVWPETERLLANSHTVLRTGNATSADLLRFAESSRQLAAWLRDFNTTLRQTLEAGPEQIEELQSLADTLVEVVPPMLHNYVRLSSVIAARDPHGRALLQEFPVGFDALTSVFEGGRLRANMLLSANDVCSYGLTDTNPQLGAEAREPFDHDLDCPRSFPLQQRGSAWRPGPTR